MRAVRAATAIWLLSSSLAQAQDPQMAAREWFREARFGMFIHWGVYSLLGKGEWVMENDGMTVSEYEKLPARFDPVAYDPAENTFGYNTTEVGALPRETCDTMNRS